MKKYLSNIDRWMGRMIAPEGMTNRGYMGNVEPADKEKILRAANGILEDMALISNNIRELVRILTQPTPPPFIEGDAPKAT